jgi:hypothetical protein
MTVPGLISDITTHQYIWMYGYPLIYYKNEVRSLFNKPQTKRL